MATDTGQAEAPGEKARDASPAAEHDQAASGSAADRSRQPAESRTRDEYADGIRDQGPPVPPPGQQNREQERDRTDYRGGANAGQDQTPPGQAGTRDHDTADTGDPRATPGGTPADREPGTPPADTPARPDSGTPAAGPAETRGRDEYASAMRQETPTGETVPEPPAGRGADPAQTPQDHGTGIPAPGTPSLDLLGSPPGNQGASAEAGTPATAGRAEADPADTPASGDQPPEHPAGPQDEHASSLPADTVQPPDPRPSPPESAPEPAGSGESPDLAGDPDPGHVADADPAADHPGDPPAVQPRDTAADAAARPGTGDDAPGSGEQAGAAPEEFSLAADFGPPDTALAAMLSGQRGPEDEQPDPEDKPASSRTPASDASGSGSADPRAAAEAGQREPQDQAESESPGQEAEDTQAKVYIGGREVELTRDPRDGVWVSGLPGEIPGTPEGDPYGTARVSEFIPGPEHEESASRLDQFADVVFDRMDDVSDVADKVSDTLSRFTDRGPVTPLVEQHQAPRYSANMNVPGLDAGHLLNSVIVLAAIGVKFRQIVRERREGRDAGD